jgi:hypothetical protein
MDPTKYTPREYSTEIVFEWLIMKELEYRIKLTIRNASRLKVCVDTHVKKSRYWSFVADAGSSRKPQLLSYSSNWQRIDNLVKYARVEFVT